MKRFYNKKFLLIVVGVVFIFVVISSFVAGYLLAKNSTKNEITQNNIQKEEALKKLQQIVEENIDKNKTAISSESVDFVDSDEAIKKEVKTEIKKESNVSKIVKVNNKPKLVIIMDDMAFKHEVDDLKKLHMKITPSFFPPTINHPHTAEYAKEFKHYMVHFPMQATNPYFHAEPYTINIDSNYSFILSRVKFIKDNFPNLKFVNNHTGSKFTSDLNSMKKLYKALDTYNLIFVDSVTTLHTKAPIVAKDDKKILLQRDVFLDNIQNVDYIKNQLKKAVKKAKEKGYAIAICHPHKATFEALKESKNILKNVDLIYIGEMYKYAKEHNISRL